MASPPPNPHRLAPALVGVLTIVGGLVSLAGWLFDVRRLTDWVGIDISMMPNAALAVAFAGAGVASFAMSRPRLAVGCGVVAGLIGWATLFENLFGLDLGIDTRLLTQTWGQRGTIAPGRMGMPASVCLAMLGVAFVLLRTGKNGRRFASFAGIAVMSITTLSLVGHLFGADVLYELPNRTAISLQTALMLFAIGGGLVLLVDDVQPMVTLRSSTPIAVLVRRMLPICVMLPIVFGFLRLQGRQAGLYDIEFGAAIVAVLETIVLCGLLLWTATALGRREREIAENRRQLEESERELRLQTERLNAFLDTAAIGLHRVGPDGTILWANDAELQMLGYRRDEYVGRHIADFHVDRAVIDDLLARLHRGERLVDCAARMRCRDGSERDVLIDASVLWDGDRFVHTQCFTSDVTEQKRLERELQQRVQQLNVEDRRKDEFLATLAHELRNPLAPVRNMLEILQHSDRGGDLFSQACVVMQRQLGHMTRLIDDLLDVSRIRTGRIALRKEPVELASIVRNAIETVQGAIEQKQHRLAVVVPPQSVWLDADPVRMAQVFGNLLSNACKYTEAGGRGAITLQARCDGDHVEVSVRDNGVGIPPEMLTKVFDMFAQVEGATGATPDGLGIGLSLVKRLVEMHGGTVAARSDGPGHGSEIVVRLPVMQRPPDVVEPVVPGSPVAKTVVVARPRRILVADDNEDAAASLALLLQMHGHEVETAADGLVALRTAGRFRPEVVLLDIGMPELNGYEVCRRLRASESGKDLVLVAITGWGQAQDRQRARDAGFDAHLVKPIDPDDLFELLSRFGSSAASSR